MEVVQQVGALRPNGHYALAVVHNGCAYISGQFSVDFETGQKKFGTVEEETQQVLYNIGEILREAGSSPERVLRTTVYVDSLSNWERINRIYSDFFGENIHARSIVCVKELHYGFKLEMDVIAAI